MTGIAPSAAGCTFGAAGRIHSPRMKPTDPLAGITRKDISACPFCGAKERSAVDTFPTTTKGVFRHAVTCSRCGAQGPLTETELEALKGWEARLPPLTTNDIENSMPFLERSDYRGGRIGDPRYWHSAPAKKP